MEERTNDLETDITRIQQLLNGNCEFMSRLDQSEASQEDSDASIDTEDDLTIQDELDGDSHWSSLRMHEANSEDSNVLDSEPTVENCLKNNLKYQILLEESIHDLEMELIRNRELQCVLRDKLSQSVSRKNVGIYHWSTFCTPYFKDRAGHIPPSNEDTKTKIATGDLFEVSQPFSWTKKEEEILMKSIIQNAQELTLNPKVAKCEVLMEEIASGELDKGTIETRKQQLAKAQLELEDLKKASSNIAIFPREFDYDWMKISVLNFQGVRSAIEVELYWKNYFHPSINKNKWSSEELEHLNRLVKDISQISEWDDIARQLGTGRNALQCCAKYQSKFNPVLKRIWTNDEKTQLLKLIEENRVGDFIPWRKIAALMEGRTLKQLWLCYNYVINPDLKKGRWDEEEDLWLLGAVWLFGDGNFWKVKQYVPNRSCRQCHERWHTILDPRLQLGKWTEAEDQKILELVERHGKKWAKIREHFKGRSSSMIARRFFSITKTENGPSNYNRPSQIEYHRRLYRHLHKCLNRLAFQKRVRRLSSKTSFEFKNSIVDMTDGKAPSSADADLRRVCLQLSIEEFHDTINPAFFIDVISKSSYVEQELCLYLSLFNTVPVRGRPVASIKVYDDSEDYQKHLAGLRKILRPEANDALLSRESVLLPPMTKTIFAFRSLLLLKNRLLSLKRRATNTAEDDEPRDLQVITRSNSYRVLFERFASLFFWPAVLSALKPDNLDNSGTAASDEPRKKKPRRKPTHWKRKQRKRQKKVENSTVTAAETSVHSPRHYNKRRVIEPGDPTRKSTRLSKRTSKS